jgi:hypothetical protein
MEFNKITSEMKFLGCSIRELNITNNAIALSSDIKKKISMDVETSEIVKGKDDLHARLLLTIEISLVSDDLEVGNINLSIEGAFAVPEKVEEDEFKKMILLNGATTLYSIVRGKIEAVTAMTFTEGKITLPMVNMIEFYEEKAKNIKQ